MFFLIITLTVLKKIPSGNILINYQIRISLFFNDKKEKTVNDINSLFAKDFEFVYLQSNYIFYHQISMNKELDFTIRKNDIKTATKTFKI